MDVCETVVGDAPIVVDVWCRNGNIEWMNGRNERRPYLGLEDNVVARNSLHSNYDDTIT